MLHKSNAIREDCPTPRTNALEQNHRPYKVKKKGGVGPRKKSTFANLSSPRYQDTHNPKYADEAIIPNQYALCSKLIGNGQLGRRGRPHAFFARELLVSLRELLRLHDCPAVLQLLSAIITVSIEKRRREKEVNLLGPLNGPDSHPFKDPNQPLERPLPSKRHNNISPGPSIIG